jgi:hypothetical protein
MRKNERKRLGSTELRQKCEIHTKYRLVNFKGRHRFTGIDIERRTVIKINKVLRRDLNYCSSDYDLASLNFFL